MPTPTLEEAICDLTEAAKTAEHHGMDAHDVPPESIRVVLAALTALQTPVILNTRGDGRSRMD